MNRKKRRGATSTEYLFCAVLIIVAILVAVGFFASTTQKTMDNNSTKIEQAFR